MARTCTVSGYPDRHRIAVMRSIEVEPHSGCGEAGALGRTLAQALEQLPPDFRAERVEARVASRVAQ